MASQRMIQREIKRENLVNKKQAKRLQLKEALRQAYAKLKVLLDAEDDGGSDGEIGELYMQVETLQDELDSLPRNASPKRQRNRCQQTGRPRGYYRKFKLCRNMIRKLAMMGYLPGVRKSSW